MRLVLSSGPVMSQTLPRGGTLRKPYCVSYVLWRNRVYSAAGMRKPKAPLAAWIVAQRKAQIPPWKAEELAARLGLSDSTVRGWESGRSVSPDNLDALERLFGLQAPGRDQQSGDALVGAIGELVAELRAARAEQAAWNEGVQGMLALLADRLPGGPVDDPAPARHEGARR